MITYKQLSDIIRKQLAILFPDKYISSGEATSKDMNSYEMQFHIVVKPVEPHLVIGFTKEEDSSMINIWNGKRENKVIDIDTDDNFIRRYHESSLYGPYTICLAYSEVSTIYDAIETFLNCDDVVDEREENTEEKVLFTFDEFDTALADTGITAVFPIRDIIAKQIYLGDNKDKIRGMSYFIKPYGMKESYYIGFFKDEGTPYVLWNGKMHNIVFEVDDRTGSISYMTPNSEVCYETNVLTLAQIKTIGEALVKHFNKNKDNESSEEDNLDKFSAEFSEGYKNYLNSLSHEKKHPLQDSPTFPEEDSVEEKEYSVPDGKFNKPIDPFKMVPIFNVDAFEVGYPYLLKNLENGKMGIVTLQYKSEDNLCFNYWGDNGEDAASSFSVSEFQGAFELYKINEIIGGK